VLTGVLYVVASAAGPVSGVPAAITAAQRRGWDACLILTPTAARWLAADLDGLARLCGHPVRSAYKMPGEPDVLPPADAMLVAPATFNTVNKWAAGISDTLALGLINEAIGMRIPIVAVPWVHGPLAAHPALGTSISVLRGAGVTVLDGAALDPGAPGSGPQAEPGSGPQAEPGSGPQAEPFPWEQALDALS
jgi:hypothetical protein